MFLSLKSEKCVFCIHSLLRIYWRVSSPTILLLLYMCLVRRLVMAGILQNLKPLWPYPISVTYILFKLSYSLKILGLCFFCQPSLFENFSLLSFVESQNTFCYNFVTMLQSIEQIGNRADRMSIMSSKLYLYSGTDIEVICSASTTCAYS